MIIAVDGPAASGKGTLARMLAQHFGFNHLDTGSLYRMVALGLLRAGIDPSDTNGAVNMARQLDIEAFGDDELRTAEVAAAASIVAAIPAVRKAILETQRTFAARPPGAVLDGRDIGTVVCPDAAVKLFVTARADVRAKRRFDELLQRGEHAKYDDVLTDLAQRDAQDRTRKISPLKPAEDALLLDTSDLSIEAAFKRAAEQVKAILDA